MNSFEAMAAFAAQLERSVSDEAMSVKVVRTPTPVREDGMIIKVSLLKTYIAKPTQGGPWSRNIRVRVSIAGKVESDQGFRDALTAIERTDMFLAAARRLEDSLGNPIPDTRLTSSITEEDSFFDGPDSLSVQELQDDRFVIITIPIKEDNDA